MYDIVFISYNEPNAEENYAKLIARFPKAKRVDGIKGIHAAHIAAVKPSLARMVWIVDGDAEILDSFNFDFNARNETDTVFVWRSINPINNLQYGYGGVKLIPRSLTLKVDSSTVDMSTSIGKLCKSMPEISNITAFNTDPFNTWRSAFRECVKLSSRIIPGQIDVDTQERLNTWCTYNNGAAYGDWAIIGANAGKKYGQENASNKEALAKINDFTWLQDRWSLGISQQ